MPDDKNQSLRQMEQKEKKQSQFAGNAEMYKRENELHLSGPETLIESSPEHREKEKISESVENKKEEGEPGAGGGGAPAGIGAPGELRKKEIEKILEKNLSGIFASLTPAKQREFKIAGEETARKISELMEKIKLNMGKVIDLIRKWLATLPGVNRYFLEQEAKLKADEIFEICDRQPR